MTFTLAEFKKIVEIYLGVAYDSDLRQTKIDDNHLKIAHRNEESPTWFADNFIQVADIPLSEEHEEKDLGILLYSRGARFYTPSNRPLKKETLAARIAKATEINAGLRPYKYKDYTCKTCANKGLVHPYNGACFVCNTNNWDTAALAKPTSAR